MDSTLTLTTDMKLVLGLVLLTVVLFMFERLRARTWSRWWCWCCSGLTGLVAPGDLFNSFSSNAVICVIATMILGAGWTAPARSTASPAGCCAARRHGEAPAAADHHHRRPEFAADAEPGGDGAYLPVASRGCPRAPACRCRGSCCRSPRRSSWAAA